MRITLITAALLAVSGSALAMNHGFDPDAPAVKWFERLNRPDFGPGNSCCGKGDAYEVSDYWHDDKGWHARLVDVPHDTRWPDGQYKKAIKPNTVIDDANGLFDTKINPESDDLDNPTDKTWAFLDVDSVTGEVNSVYCFIRHPKGI